MRLIGLTGALIGWNLAGYPLFVTLLAKLRKRTPESSEYSGPVSVIVAAHNEADCIRSRIRNLRAQNYEGPLEIIVVSDGSTDGTATEARAEGAIVLEQRRSGKVAALRAGVERAQGEVLVITDANTRFDDDAIRRLVAPFSDPRIGIAAGDLRYENVSESDSSWAENLYWNYETKIKESASQAGLLLMGAGGIYAVRRMDWPEDLTDDLADDSYVPLSLHRSGRHNVFVRTATGYERAGTRMEEEWRRRVRMVAQDVRVARKLEFGFPNNETAFALISQKVLRWTLFPLGLVFLADLHSSLTRRTRISTICGAVLGGGVLARQRPSLARKAVMSGIYLGGAAGAAFVGFVLGLSGRSRAIWEKAPTTRRP